MNKQINSNGWTKWLVATLWSTLAGVILFMGNVVRTNDLNNRSAHDILKSEINAVRHDYVQDNIKLKDCVSDIKTNLAVQTTILHRIEKKIDGI